jgi:hypothetical protein
MLIKYINKDTNNVYLFETNWIRFVYNEGTKLHIYTDNTELTIHIECASMDDVFSLVDGIIEQRRIDAMRFDGHYKMGE